MGTVVDPPGCSVVGLGVWDASITVCTAVIEGLVGEGVALGVSVGIGLGVMTEKIVAVLTRVEIMLEFAWQAVTPVVPRLYASRL